MKLRAFLAVALLAATASSFALSPEYADWVNGPAQFLMTKEEQAQVKALKTDAEAKAFVDLFWARRDPTPDTPQNEAREAFDARVAFADKGLREGKTRGAMTDRGKVLILYGQPKRQERDAKQPTFDTMSDSESAIQWHYEGDEARAAFNVPRATIRFTTRTSNSEYKVERGIIDLNAAQARVIQKMIVRPDLTAVPAATAAPAAAAPVAAAPAPAGPMTALTTAALATAVNEFKAAAKNPYDNQGFATSGEYVTPSGETFVPVMLYLPKSAGLSGDQQVTFFGVVEDASGKSVLAFEEPRILTAAQGDFYVDKSLTLPAGKHRGIFGITQGAKLILAATDMELAGNLDKDAAAVSPLLLSNFVQALTEAQRPTDPFAFGGVKVVPKADKAFRKTDELWYFFEMRNPGLSETEQKPAVQVKMDMVGKTTDGKPVKMGAALREVEPVAMKGVPGHYGVGNAIPLESFSPGEYTFTLKVIDTVKKASYTLSDTFRIVE